MNLREILRLPLRLVPSGRVVRILSGPLRGGRWITGVAPHGCWLGTYEHHTQELFRRHIKPGAIVFDIGANVGFFTLLASRLAGETGRVFAFEPLPRNLELLREHVRLNHATNVTVMPLAVSTGTGSARFFLGENPSQGTLAQSGEIEVNTDSLDRLVGGGSVSPPDFVKMDIEGGEDDVLTGSTEVLRSARPTLLLSTHGFEHHQNCWTLLEQAGYDLRLERDGNVDGDYLILASAR